MLEAAFYGLVTAFLWGFGDFLTKRPMSKLGYYFTTGYVQFFGFLGFTVYALALNDSFSPLLASPMVFALNLVVGVLNFLGILFLYRGFASGVMSIVSPISSSYPAITVLFSVLFLGVTINGAQGLGIAVVILGVALGSVALPGRGPPGRDPAKTGSEAGLGPRRGWTFVKGVDSAVLSCFSFGSLYLVLRFVTPVFGPVIPVVVLRGTASLITVLLFRPLRKEFRVPGGRSLLLLVFIGLIDTAGYLFLSQGILLSRDSLPIVVTLSSMASLVVVVLASAFYKERLGRTQVAGVAAVILGIAAILNS